MEKAIERHNEAPAHFYGHFLDFSRGQPEGLPFHCEAPLQPWLAGLGGHPAPGVLGTMADMCMSKVVRYVPREKYEWHTTVDLHVHHMADPEGPVLRSICDVVAQNRETVLARCEMQDAGGRTCAVASGIFLLRSIPRGEAASAPPPSPLAAEEFRRWVMALPERATGSVSPFAAYLGIENLPAEPGRSRLRMPCGLHNLNNKNMVHGGALYAICSEGMLAAGPGSRLLELKVNYLLPAKGSHLVAETAILRGGRRLQTAMCQVYDEQGQLVTMATGTLTSSTPAG